MTNRDRQAPVDTVDGQSINKTTQYSKVVAFLVPLVHYWISRMMMIERKDDLIQKGKRKWNKSAHLKFLPPWTELWKPKGIIWNFLLFSELAILGTWAKRELLCTLLFLWVCVRQFFSTIGIEWGFNCSVGRARQLPVWSSVLAFLPLAIK